ncbi:MAG: regulatory signaling modulator protein AmpE [Pseudomonadota bacterium]
MSALHLEPRFRYRPRMKLIALLLALLAERLATHLFHWRELRWIRAVVDRMLDWPQRFPAIGAMAAVSCLLLLLVAPLIWIWFATGDTLLGVPYLVFSIVVLFLCLGPQDIGEEVDAWSDAVRTNDNRLAAERASALLDCDPRPSHTVVEAVFVQGNNRIFSVVFWFVLLGPIGAWAMKMADVLRRRSIVRREILHDVDPTADATDTEALVRATETVHAMLAWVPARLAAISYAIAGSFDRAWEAWGKPVSNGPISVGEGNDRVLIDIGCAALAFVPDDSADDTPEVQGAQAAKRLLFRALIAWVVVLSLVTLAGPVI